MSKAFYWSVLEFGVDVLSHEAGWMIGGYLRSNIAKKVRGEMSQVLKLMMLRLLDHRDHSMLENGIVISTGDRPEDNFLVFIRVKIILADWAAWAGLFLLKSAAAIRFCMWCMNAVSERSQLADIDTSGTLVSSACSDITEFIPQTDAGLRRCAQDLAGLCAPPCTKKKQKQTETCFGMNHHPQNILLCAQLEPYVNPCSMVCADWQHIYCVQGIANDELWMLIKTLKRNCRITMDDIHNFLRVWETPNHLKTKNPKTHLFDQKRQAAYLRADSLKAGSSELLFFYPIMMTFVHMLFSGIGAGARAGAMMLERASLSALCDVMNTLQCIPLGLVTPALLHARIKRHFDAHKAAYDSENYFMRPKWHLSLHLSEHLRRFGTLLSCFTLERRHKALKLLARHTTNTRAFEKSCTIDMLLHHLGELNRPDSLARGTCLLEGLMFSLISVNEQ